MSKHDAPHENQVSEDASEGRLSWSKPTVKTNSVVERTAGGFRSVQVKGDDTWYVS